MYQIEFLDFFIPILNGRMLLPLRLDETKNIDCLPLELKNERKDLLAA